MFREKSMHKMWHTLIQRYIKKILISIWPLHFTNTVKHSYCEHTYNESMLTAVIPCSFKIYLYYELIGYNK